MHKMPWSIKQNATIGGGDHFDPLLGKWGCRKASVQKGYITSETSQILQPRIWQERVS